MSSFTTGRRRLERRDLSSVRRVVIKAGTAVLSRPDGQPAISRIANIVEQISALRKSGVEVIFVASGAVGIGRQRLDRQRLLSSSLRTHAQGRSVSLGDHPQGACAAAGQMGLMSLYDALFNQYNIACSQVLVLASDFRAAERRQVLRTSITAMVQVGMIPIINENDAVGAPPDGKIFSDNDSLAALIASELRAELLLLLTDVNGVYNAPPSEPGARMLAAYDPRPSRRGGSQVKVGEKGSMGRGGMQSKIDAAQGAVDNGVGATVICSGLAPNTIGDAIVGKNIGTLFNIRTDDDIDDGEQADADAAADDADDAEQMAISCREAGRVLAGLDSETRAGILMAMSKALLEHKDEVLAANARDVAAGEQLSTALKGRLKLTEEKLRTLAEGIASIGAMEEPLDRLISSRELSQGLVLEQRTVPIGALLIIFESRPDSLPQIVALAVRSGNGLMLKGGKEALHSNAVLHRILVDAIHTASGGRVPRQLVGLVTSRDTISDLLALDHVLDLCIPRGSNELVAHIKNNTKIPVMGHGDGVCHVYVDQHADPELAVRLVIDAKTDYPSACNAAETVLLHRALLDTPLPQQLLRALGTAGVAVRAGPNAVAAKLLPESCAVESLHVEYGELALCVEIVGSVEEAAAHANRHGSGHTECIVTRDAAAARHFLRTVDSACVFHNASTRFADGYRFGLGAEVGISTARIHARGPVGVEGLLAAKWLLASPDGHIVGDFAGDAPKCTYTHRTLPIPSKL